MIINALLRYPMALPIYLSGFLGLLFPIMTILFMFWHQQLSLTWDNVVAMHRTHYVLIVVWTAPLFLGFFGSIIGRIGSLLKQKMDSLAYRTTQLNTILDSAASAIITIDMHGSILSFNHSAEQIFGYQLSEIIGKNVNCLMPEETAAQHDGFLHRNFENPHSSIIGKRREVKAQRKNGENFPALFRVNPMNIDGGVFFSGLIDDISETKHLEAQLNQAQKLEAIGQLASGVAHEINTPIQYIGDNLAALHTNLTDIIAYQQALYAELEPALHPQLDNLAEQFDLAFILEDSPKAIKQSLDGVRKVTEIVKAMKVFSHFDASQNKQRFNLHEALTSAIIISRNHYKYIADIETDFAQDLGAIEGYASDLNQVFLNLIINAAHAIDEKKITRGLIRITTCKLKNDNMVEILIQDNGMGIPNDIKEKVFNLFFTTKPVGKGTGQGLSLAHTVIVEKHRGKLFFESTSGEGTTFHIQLPMS